MTQPSNEALSSPAASILRRRGFWIAFVAVLAVLAAMAGGSALAARGELVNTARTVDAGPEGALAVDRAVTSSRPTSGQGQSNQESQGQGNQGNQESQGQGNQGSQGNGNQGNQGNQGNGNQGSGNQGSGNQGSGNQGSGNQGSGNQGNGNQTAPEAPTPPAPDAPADGVVEVPSVVVPPSEVEPVEPVLTLPDVLTPSDSPTPVDEEPVDEQPVEVPADEPVDQEPVEEPQVPVVVVPQPAAVPVVAMGIAPGCVGDQAVLVQQAQNEDTKGVSVHFLANADFPASGSQSLTTAPDEKKRNEVSVTAVSGKAYVGAGSIAVRTYRAAQTVGGVAFPAVSETRTLAYDAFTCEKPAVVATVKAQLVNGRIVLALYARNTGNTPLQVKFNPTAHFPGSASFALAPGAARYSTVPTDSAAVPASAVSVNVVSSVQGKRVALNRIAKHDALSVAVPD